MQNKKVNLFLSYGVRPVTLYTNFHKKHKVSLRQYDVKQCVRSWGSLQECFASIFKYLFLLIIQDVIEEGITFKFPSNCMNSFIEMVPVSGEDFKDAYRKGAFQDIDFLASNFTGYQVQFRMTTKYGKWCKRIYVTQKYKDRIAELTNKGRKW